MATASSGLVSLRSESAATKLRIVGNCRHQLIRMGLQLVVGGRGDDHEVDRPGSARSDRARGGVTGKARTPGTAKNSGCSFLAISVERVLRSLQSRRPANEMPCDTVGLPDTTK